MWAFRSALEPRTKDAAAYRLGKFALSDGDPRVRQILLCITRGSIWCGHKVVQGGSWQAERHKTCADSLGGEFSWNRRKLLPHINSGWRARNASVSYFCPHGRPPANFQPPAIDAAPGPGIGQARSCRSGPRNPVIKRRSRGLNPRDIAPARPPPALDPPAAATGVLNHCGQVVLYGRGARRRALERSLIAGPVAQPDRAAVS
jgi:hypothetical protein